MEEIPSQNIVKYIHSFSNQINDARCMVYSDLIVGYNVQNVLYILSSRKNSNQSPIDLIMFFLLVTVFKENSDLLYLMHKCSSIEIGEIKLIKATSICEEKISSSMILKELQDLNQLKTNS